MEVAGIQVLEEFSENASLGEIVDTISSRIGGNVWFRGEAKEYLTPAMPLLARHNNLDLSRIEPDFADKEFSFPIGILTKAEEVILSELRASPPDDPYFHKLVGSPDDPAWLALARHHGHPTRLLDVTWDIFVALYFACGDLSEEYGYVFAFIEPWDPDSNRSKKPDSIKRLLDAALGDSIPAYRDADKTDPGVLTKHAHQLESTWQIRYSHAYLWECTAVLNERMVAQRGAFLWRGDPKESILRCSGSNPFIFRIHPQAKPKILDRLKKLGLSEKSLKIGA